jgi:hypothetical protein
MFERIALNEEAFPYERHSPPLHNPFIDIFVATVVAARVPHMGTQRKIFKQRPPQARTISFRDPGCDFSSTAPCPDTRPCQEDTIADHGLNRSQTVY